METTSFIEIPEQHLPVKIISVKVEKDQQIDKNSLICLYEISNNIPETSKLNSSEKNKIEELRSNILGKIEEVNIKVGQIINTKNYAVIKIVEPCSHAVQWKGMCTLCGKDCSIDGSDSSRATIQMTHDASELFVSQNEAQKLEKENSTRLINQRKLSLILDLDQTIIHATIDPTIGVLQNDPNNSNYEILKDVYHFVLPDSDTVYYIKLRPGVREFLKEIKQYYELHIYTMGTRSYANAVAKIIDPTSEYFGNRILSRDESGSFASKSIQRLFPCDQSMVVVIDDRGDVWSWSENLIKVQPYNFFVGIGDINNTSFLIEQEKNKQMATDDKKENSDEKIKKEENNNSSEKEESKETNDSKKDENNEVKNEINNSNDKLNTGEITSSKNTVLVDNDHELEVVKNVLKDIHKSFYTSYDNKETDVSVQKNFENNEA
jgi:RNA polymerase II subunit A-like phosphatase